jgi:hypothetical protein
MAYRVNVAVELQTDDPEGLLFKSAMGQWGHSFFLDTEDNALAFCKALPKRPMGERMARHQYDLVWYLAYPAADVINVEDPDDLASRWERTDGVITSDRCVVKGYRSAKSRHLFHMIALPSFVSAAARMLGHDVPEFDLSELRTNNLFTDAEFAALCGSPDAGKAGHEDEPSWDNSVLFNRRAEVWAALGESNPKVQHTGRTGGKYATASVPLDTVLSAVYSSWTTPVWAKVVSVVNPHLSATYDNSEGETRHERLSVITEVYERGVVPAVGRWGGRGDRKHRLAACPSSLPGRCVHARDVRRGGQETGRRQRHRGSQEPRCRCRCDPGVASRTQLGKGEGQWPKSTVSVIRPSCESARPSLPTLAAGSDLSRVWRP